MASVEDVDFYRDPGLVDDPYPWFAEVRRRCPVQHEPHHDTYLVTGYGEALEVYHDTETFSSCTSVTGPFPGLPVELEGDDVTEQIEAHRDGLPFSDQLPTFDPPKHTQHRGLLMRLLTPKRMKENEAFMWDLADRQVGELLAREDGEYIKGFAGPFTMLVIADLLGVPASDHDEFRQKLTSPERSQGLGSTGDETLSHRPLEYLYDKFTEYLEDRRRQPTGDVLSGLAAATFPDGTVPDVADVARIASNLFAAGQETTIRLLAASMQRLGEDADLQARLRAEPERIPDFVEEMLRYESPVKGDFRLSRVPTTVGGVDLGAGTTVMVLNGAANRDPRKFEDPDTFDLDRANAKEHLAFGHGIHFCPGASLARVEGRVAIERLLERTSHLGISEEHHGPPGDRRYRYAPTFILRGLTHLHLDLTPA